MFFGSIQFKVSSKGFESAVSVVKYFKLIPVLICHSGDCFEVVTFSFRGKTLQNVEILSKIHTRVLTENARDIIYDEQEKDQYGCFQ